MPLARLVDAAAALAATRSRTAKTEVVASVLRDLRPDEAEAAVGLLLGRLRQGSIGLGYRTVLAARKSAAPADTAALTIGDVDSVLDEIAGLGGSGSTGARNTALVELFGQATATELDYLVRAFTGEMRTGALEGVLTDGLARAVDLPLTEVRRAVMLSGSLAGTVGLALESPESLADVGLAVLTPVQPMLASTAADVGAALAVTGEASVEHKLDGARIQVHRSGSDVRVFTRSLADITPRVPEIVEVALSLPVDSVILDGETLMLDDDGGPRPFQDTMSRFGADQSREQVLAPRFFDALHLDGEDLIDRPLSERLAVLERIAPAYRIAGEVTTDPVVAERISREALAVGHEGVMIKAVDSTYAAGRRGKHWVKVKPVHTYDLVVLGVERGSGRRQGWLSNLHLGARDPEGEFGPAGGFVMVGKTFKGLTDELLQWQTETFPDYGVDDNGWALMMRPEIVVEIAIDGVQRSSRYPGGVALRFARVKRYRVDGAPGSGGPAGSKRAAEADTIQTLRALLRT
ncbi:ATP-dependent DNA ligase [Knoellia sinensis KCTC 19936]|uniref:DNA ligase n=1 Tax=Knoellia sinensis KCTC 19936 TaxID=1385520 RepID=A0A0A0J5A7_9MICO|nr:ATP-dependent DNA ligase [Knoellia sinensis]KGN30801.1 ATP-dependent DNA ligase [Knoellia sinensis KCTC 19936]